MILVYLRRLRHNYLICLLRPIWQLIGDSLSIYLEDVVLFKGLGELKDGLFFLRRDRVDLRHLMEVLESRR
jgi:hypothetical protein